MFNLFCAGWFQLCRDRLLWDALGPALLGRPGGEQGGRAL